MSPRIHMFFEHIQTVNCPSPISACCVLRSHTGVRRTSVSHAVLADVKRDWSSTKAAPKASKPPPGAPLPRGWTEETDPDSGTIYFYNEAQNRSVWDRPS